MRFFAIGRLAGAALCVALAAASSSNAAPTARTVVIPAPGPRGQVRSFPSRGTGGQVRHISRRARRWSVPTCTGVGFGSFVGGGAGTNIALGFESGVLSGNGNHACDDYSGIAAGLSNGIGADADATFAAFIGAGSQNAVTNAASGAFIGAGQSNIVTNALDGFLGAGELNTDNGTDSALVSGNSNTVSNTDGFIGAGKSNNNSGADSVIVGGLSNGVPSTGAAAFIGGGGFNSASGGSAVIGGGNTNTVSGSNGFIGGGADNVVSGSGAVISGGGINRAPGTYATVPGGFENYASGFASFAGGDNSAAVNAGAFVWSDSAGGTRLVSSASNQFLAKASGGVKFFSNKTLTTGVMLGAGSGTWASVSDRAVKTNVAAIDDAGILDKIASLPISEWSYISEHGVRHVGPMAQDFYAAFGVGADNKHITSIDEDGVALAAIKALHHQVSDLKVQLARKDAAVSAMQRQLQKLSAAVASIRSR